MSDMFTDEFKPMVSKKKQMSQFLNLDGIVMTVEQVYKTFNNKTFPHWEVTVLDANDTVMGMFYLNRYAINTIGSAKDANSIQLNKTTSEAFMNFRRVFVNMQNGMPLHQAKKVLWAIIKNIWVVEMKTKTIYNAEGITSTKQCPQISYNHEVVVLSPDNILDERFIRFLLSPMSKLLAPNYIATNQELLVPSTMLDTHDDDVSNSPPVADETNFPSISSKDAGAADGGPTATSPTLSWADRSDDDDDLPTAPHTPTYAEAIGVPNTPDIDVAKDPDTLSNVSSDADSDVDVADATTDAKADVVAEAKADAVAEAVKTAKAVQLGVPIEEHNASKEREAELRKQIDRLTAKNDDLAKMNDRLTAKNDDLAMKNNDLIVRIDNLEKYREELQKSLNLKDSSLCRAQQAYGRQLLEDRELQETNKFLLDELKETRAELKKLQTARA